MALSINQNIAAMNSYRNLSNTQNEQAKSLEKLSSGFRINRAADDAAGLAISEGLRSQVGGLKVAARNAQDGISVVQTAEGALTEVHSILQRMRDLGVQAANDSNNTEARANIATEATSLKSELTRIADSTNFNGTKLLDGSVPSLKFQVGANGDANSQITVNLSNIKAVADNLGAAGVTFNVATPSTVGGAQSFTTVVNGNTTTANVNLAAAGTYKTVGAIADALNNDTTFKQTFSASVDKDNKLVVSSKIGGTVGTADPSANVTGGAATAAGLDFSSAAGAQAAIGSIDNQIKTVSTARAALGAMQNRFEHTIKNINVSVENLSASESRIRDTDMAAEMMSMTRSQILSQAGTAMLSQANQIPQGVLSLLR